MNVKQTFAVLAVLISLMALLGCVEEERDCAADVMECPDGTFVSRNPKNNCEFYECPVETGSQEPQPEERVIGPEYYNSEQEAFDALSQELEQMEDLSMQELESILGE